MNFEKIVNMFRTEWNLSKTIRESRDLASKILEEWKPSIVLAIGETGVIPAKIIAKQIYKSYCRSTNTIKYGEIGVKHSDSKKQDLIITNSNTFDIAPKKNEPEENILLVYDNLRCWDDYEVILKDLTKKHNHSTKNIKIASLTHNEMNPDFTNYKGNIIFPWNKPVDSKEYMEYASLWLQAIKESKVYKVKIGTPSTYDSK